MPKETTKEQRPKKGEQMQHECVHAVRKTNKKKKMFFFSIVRCLFTSFRPQFLLHDDRKPVARRCGVVIEWSTLVDLTMEEEDDRGRIPAAMVSSPPF
jgi:hypothetical protein